MSVTVPILQMRELKPREVKRVVQDYIASQLLDQHFKSGQPDVKVWLLIIQGREGGEKGRKEWNIY